MLTIFLAVAALASAPAQLDRPAIAACLGTPDFALNVEAVAAARAQITEVQWRDACRQARDANARRVSALRVLFATGRSPLPGHESTTNLVRHAREATDPVLRDLYLHVARDQAARESTQRAEKAGFAPGASPLALRLVDGLSSADALRADADNRTWLKATVAARGWFTIGRDGAYADQMARLIVQHADGDPAFQREMIAFLEPLAATGETSATRFALTFDRWARNAGALQRYGVMGDCTGPGAWTPRPTEDEANLDARRVQAGLTPMAQHRAEQARGCR